MIDKDLRGAGVTLKLLNRSFTKRKMRMLNKLLHSKLMTVHDDALIIETILLSRKDGSTLRVCLFKPKYPINDVPGILWLHGGGYAFGAPEQASAYAKRLIETSPAIVIAPDYRTSLEAPYPAALEDSYQTLLWMKDHAAELGIRKNQLMIGGDSAGGGLTVATCLYARDQGEVSLAFQMPLYPMLDDRMNTPSAKDNNAPLWNSKSNDTAWKLYLGNLFETSKIPYYAAPARATNYRSLPPAATFVGDLEPFRDETLDYIQNLQKAGIPVKYEVYKGCFHGFDAVCPKADVSIKAVNFIMDAYQFAVQNYFA